jgi:hypothetical protein
MRFVTQVLLVGVVCGGILAALPDRSMAAAQDSQAGKAFAPDHALTLALAKGEKSAVGALLDAKCQWVDVTGTVRNKAEALEGRNSAKPSAFALRMFIDRGAGWKICLSIHTQIAANE